jgi:hypothetical protein
LGGVIANAVQSPHGAPSLSIVKAQENLKELGNLRTAGGNGRAELLRNSMFQKGWEGAPVDVVKLPDGRLVTIDNTRVAVAREVGLEKIPVNIRGMGEILAKEMTGRFGEAKTWGEALGYSIGRQVPPLPISGSPNSPRIPKR